MKPDRARYGHIPVTGTCPATGKLSFTGRKDAKAYARKLLPGSRVHPYTCPTCDWWHLGHLPAVVKGGHIPRSQLGGET